MINDINNSTTSTCNVCTGYDLIYITWLTSISTIVYTDILLN
jgi:hypothetical protein